MILILLLTNTALTAVTAYELTPASEFVDGKTTVIGTSRGSWPWRWYISAR